MSSSYRQLCETALFLSLFLSIATLQEREREREKDRQTDRQTENSVVTPNADDVRWSYGMVLTTLTVQLISVCGDKCNCVIAANYRSVCCTIGTDHQWGYKYPKLCQIIPAWKSAKYFNYLRTRKYLNYLIAFPDGAKFSCFTRRIDLRDNMQYTAGLLKRNLHSKGKRPTFSKEGCSFPVIGHEPTITVCDVWPLRCDLSYPVSKKTRTHTIFQNHFTITGLLLMIFGTDDRYSIYLPITSDMGREPSSLLP